MPTEPLTAPALERAAASEFGVPIAVTVAREMIDLPALTPAERKIFERLKAEARQHTWLMGRAALKPLMRRLRAGDDTASLTFPHTRFSLAHTDEAAVAIATPTAQGLGIGVDVERADRQPQERAARFFLSAAEQKWLAAQPAADQPLALLRLWTVKEALYKANPDNAGTVLNEYETHNPGANAGTARILLPGSMWLFRYATYAFADAVVSIALTVGGSRCQTP